MTSRIVAIGNLKGGVGKSTIAVNLACELSGPRTIVSVIDADTQGTAAEWIKMDKLPVQGVVLPLEEERHAEQWLSKVFAIEADWKVIDLPPHIGAATAAALVVADIFLLPVIPSGFDLRATAKALDLLHEARQERGDSKPKCLLVPSKVDRRTGAGREIEAALHEFGEPVSPAIGQRTAFVDSGTAGEWVGSYAPRSVGHVEIQTLTAIVRRMAK